MEQNLDLWIVCVLIRGELERRGRRAWKVCANVRVFCACCNGVVEQSDNAGRKENMIEWDILSAADVSWSPDCVCVCVSIGVYQSLSHPGPVL